MMRRHAYLTGAALLTAAIGVTGCDDQNNVGVQEDIDATTLGQPTNTFAQAEDPTIAVPAGTLDPAAEAEETDVEVEAVGVVATGEAQSLNLPGYDAVQIERTGETEVRAGEQFTYEIVVTNTTESPLFNVVVKEITSPGFQIAQSTPQFQTMPMSQQEAGVFAFPAPPEAQNQQRQGQGQQPMRQQGQQGMGQQNQPGQGDVQMWQLGMLGPNESRTITVTGAAGAEGNVRSCLLVDYTPTVCTVVNVVQPELNLDLAIIDAEENILEEAYICEPAALRLTLTNTGSAQTQPAIIRTQLPPGVTAVESELPEGARLEGPNVLAIRTGQPVDPDQAFVAVIPLEINQPRQLAVQATATTGQLTVQSDRETAVFLEPELALTVDGPARQYLGRPLVYRFTVENTSDAPALDTVVAVDLPDGMRNMALSSQRIEQDGEAFLIGDLGPGEARSFDISFDLNQPGELAIAATAEAYCAQAQEPQLVRTVLQGIPAALVTTVDNRDPVRVGETTVYQIVVKNQGTAPDMNVQVQAQLPQGMEFVHGEGDTNVNAQGNTIRFAPVDQVDPGEVVTWKVQARAVEPGATRFNVEMVSDANEEPVIAQEPTTLY